MRDARETATEEVDRIMDEDYQLGRLADDVQFLARRAIDAVDERRRGNYCTALAAACNVLANYAEGLVR